MGLREVTDATFEAEVLGSDRPVLVDYWADWCTPCRQLEPIIEELEARYGDRMEFVKIDTGENPISAAEQQVRGLPTVQIFAGGEAVRTFQGSKPKTVLREAIEAQLCP
ncbi:thioredoxin [Naumannella cuiyingiana]|uniref:Thioredoxin n=1 Tax=Naumannella cuiyingiana TaxID=1347891 RepID=A0A7Z0D918_9ACTN|nr:thioredoxin [Naumannella cuiyingiana]NYI71034.1 thioredoxin 1 [Naumannella cuiyingiana]